MQFGFALTITYHVNTYYVLLQLENDESLVLLSLHFDLTPSEPHTWKVYLLYPPGPGVQKELVEIAPNIGACGMFDNKLVVFPTCF